jgi:hypothetical protein
MCRQLARCDNISDGKLLKTNDDWKFIILFSVFFFEGIYCKLWDELVQQAKGNSISAAVVFLPQYTSAFGAHGSDKCYCVEMVSHSTHFVYADVSRGNVSCFFPLRVSSTGR